MAIVQIRINGREYQVACNDGEEDQLQFLAAEVNDRLKAMVHAMGSNPGEPMALLLTALTMADEIIENKREIQNIATEVKRLAMLVNDDKKIEQQDRMVEIEHAMAITLEEIALRIEKIAEQIEVD